MSLDIKSADAVKLIKDAARKLTRAKRRKYEAHVTQELLAGSARRAETVFGWSRQTNSQRTQFMQRMVDFADRTGLRLHLVYYPPYHSKYN